MTTRRYLFLVSFLVLGITPGLNAKSSAPSSGGAQVFGSSGQNDSDVDQQVNDFSLAGFGERGKKSWELSGKSADIFTDIVKLKDIIGNLYGDKEQIKLTADNGNFDKAEGLVHLEDNVIVTTSSGARLTTDSLDWDRKKQLVTTRDAVNIERENMITTALGATAHPNLNNVILEKDVTVKINPPLPVGQEALPLNNNKTVITCDGPMSINYEKNVATFTNNVEVDRGDSQIYSDTMDVYFNMKDDPSAPAKNDPGPADANPLGMGAGRIDRMVARGNVKIVRGENVSYSDEAIYTATDKKITLSGKPKLVIYSTQDMDQAFAK